MSDLLGHADLGGLGLTGIREAVTAGGVPVLSADLPRGTHDTVWCTLRARHARTGMWPVRWNRCAQPLMGLTVRPAVPE
ncbi:hypothetical protein [Catenuloplanes indicus]|uniref:Uncharacterized protein n=1 Tax=Catenuloplanes indicus TaxID=137267 RepID=A0AAE3W6K6_9ACTN|nr:hypothetical protein [Catenuloplanes indicus]